MRSESFAQRRECGGGMIELPKRKNRSVVGAKCAKHNAISINLLGLLGMVITAYVMVVQESDHSNIVGVPVVMLGDNSLSLHYAMYLT